MAGLAVSISPTAPIEEPEEQSDHIASLTPCYDGPACQVPVMGIKTTWHKGGCL